jgi:TusE/DsrC/DsvC family sulfur relay protein
MTERVVAGKALQFDEDGFMANYEDWNKEIAEELASEIGINPLTDRHWTVIDFCREDFVEQGDSPTIRRITSQSGVATKELYSLFPKGPAKKVAYVSGLKKPTGCI